ncbi:hypothetical protein, partial [Williamwhitmania taraxaci]|uniref:hypothetical protein n=1 Tax=Williamwhitmania taraxaci TaxID=1640674 RepID=UPI001BAF0E10
LPSSLKGVDLPLQISISLTGLFWKSNSVSRMISQLARNLLRRSSYFTIRALQALADVNIAK